MHWKVKAAIQNLGALLPSRAWAIKRITFSRILDGLSHPNGRTCGAAACFFCYDPTTLSPARGLGRNLTP